MIDAIVIGAGQSGLTAARTLADHHLTPVMLEAGPDPVESWPHCYDSLTLYSPAQIGAERSGPDVAESQPARRDRRADAAAATAAGPDEVIERLFDGWNALVGEGDAHLPGVERQRVSLARALLRVRPS